ncbi:MAG: DUF6693 family protein [Desulfovibrio sp.]|uniref:DUF6693 family protein n=1 Tax=Desulfovibrio sp. 7SRBS1 TaxID=3378064 RepID=UPI003B3E6AC1
MRVGRFYCELTIGSSIGHLLLWYLIIICTLGLGSFLYPYALAKFVINKTWIMEGDKPVGRLRCDLDIPSQIGHVLLWILLSIVTLGLAALIFLYRVGCIVANDTVIEPVR